MMKVVTDPAFLPPSKRAKCDVNTVLDLRTYDENQKIPVVMASYGSQHIFSHAALSTRGCLAHFFMDSKHGHRLFHPCELAMLHGAVGNVFALHDYPTAWRHQGNQIAVMHAMQVLARVCKFFDFAQHVEFSDILQTWEDQRLKATNSILTQGQGGYQLRHVGFPFELRERHHQKIFECVSEYGKGMLPPDQWWDVHGFHAFDTPFPKHPFMNTDFQSQMEVGTQITQPTVQDSQDTIMPSLTQHFCVTLKAVIRACQWKIPFWFASNATPSDLQMLWHGGFAVNQDADITVLHETEEQTLLTIEHRLIPILVDGRLTVYAHEEGDMQSFFTATIGEMPRYDQFGEVPGSSKFRQHMLLTSVPQQHGILTCEVPLLLAAFHNCTMCFRYRRSNDVWFCEFTGDEMSRKLLAKVFAHAITKETLFVLGRAVSIEHDEHTIVAFGHAECGTPAPPAVLPMCFAIALTRSALDALQSEDGLPVIFKWCSRVLWKGNIDKFVTAEVVKTIMMYTLAPVMHLREVRLVHGAKQFASGPFQLFEHPSNLDTVFLLSFELCGGAGQISTKGQLRQQVRNSFAAWLLETGIELQWVQQHLEQIIDDIGVKQLVPIIQQPASAKRDSQLKQALEDAKIRLPEPAKTHVSVHAMRSKVKKRHVIMPDATDYKVNCTYLLKENGDEVMQLQDFRANMTGVYLTNAAGALPWLRDSQQLSADELGLLIIGPLPHDTTLPTTEVALPCFNSDKQQVLLQVTLVQFGAKQVKIRDWDQNVVSTATSKVCSLTLWQQDWSKEEWTSALHHTSQFLKEIFLADGIQDAIGSTWGRSLRKGKQPATHRDATSMQIHAAIHDAQFLPFLKATGYNRVWAAPKAEDGRLAGDYRILWLPVQYDLQKASTITAKLAGVAGLVRGKTSIGVRMTAGSFDAAWAIVYPQSQAPVDVSNKYTFKIEPLPYGCNSEMLLEWASHIQWKIRPLKATGPKAWIVCSGEDPPPGPLSFNGQPVLPRKMQPRSATKEQAILAGPRAKISVDPPSYANVTTASPTDPWWAYLNKQSGSQMPQPAANTPGPTEQRLAQQDAKVAELETKIQAMQTVQGQQTGLITQIQNDIQQTEQKLAQSLTQAMDKVKADLTCSFGDALQKQTKSFEANFNDLKNALLQTKRKAPDEGDQDMHP